MAHFLLYDLIEISEGKHREKIHKRLRMPPKILSVDDSQTFRAIVKRAFRPYDCEFIEAINGLEGLKLAARENPDLIILDVAMPKMDGVTMARKLRNRPSLKDIPIIVLTATPGQKIVIELAKLGIKDFIAKPHNGDFLIKKVKKFIKLRTKAADESIDTSENYVSFEDDIQFLKIPEKVTKQVMAGIENHLLPKFEEMDKAEEGKLILDLNEVKVINYELIKLITMLVQKSKETNKDMRVVAQSSIGSQLKEFSDIKNISIDHSIEEAKAALKLF